MAQTAAREKLGHALRGKLRQGIPAKVPTPTGFWPVGSICDSLRLEWIKEFARLLRPGGTLVVTTRERDFILGCARLRDDDPDTLDPLTNYATMGARGAFLDTERSLDRYDAGEYRCDATGACDKLPSDAYGETCIPLAYAQRQWQPHFSVIEFKDDAPEIRQNVIVARRT